MIDTHAHIYLDHFSEDLAEIINKSISKGIDRIYLPNIDEASLSDVWTLVKEYPEICYPMIGLHPCSVKKDFQEQLDFLYQRLQSEKYAGIGEIGIDLYWDKTYEKEQIEAFRTQIAWAKEKNLPFVIHSRESLDMTIDIVTELQDGALRGIFHCFNGSLKQAQRIMDINFLMGIGGVVTFKNAGVDKVVADIPMDYLVLETDAPYLTPVPYRGKRNEPSYLAYIAKKLSDLKNISVEEVDQITTNNAFTLFAQ